MGGFVLGRRDLLNELAYTASSAFKSSPFWRARFEGAGIEPEELTPEMLLEHVEDVNVTPKDLYSTEKLWPDYIRERRVFHTILKTSGTTGKSKLVPFTLDDKRRVARQLTPWVEEYVEDGDVIASFFPPLPSASGMMGFGAFEAMEANVRYIQLPIQLLRMGELLIREFEEINPTQLFGLTTTVYNLGFRLPEKVREDISLILVGGETLTLEMAQAMLENYPNAVIVDVYGTSEDGSPAYRVITKKRTGDFVSPHSLLTLTETEDEGYYAVHITKIMLDGELTGLPIFNYAIGDIARVEGGRIRNIIRTKDAVSLAGAKLFLDQVMEVVFSHQFLSDFVILYEPLSRDNPKPRAIIRVGFSGERPRDIEDEIRARIYEGNNPVRYEVEESKQAELLIEVVPLAEVRKGLPQRPGKTKRIFIKGVDF
ncbi:AMP-binding protein [Palaeococcus ferrophilus]|uniref:AMP-binding protein n=1 Tax=Palaeococcus ferrophilus TaxID=83868 RepID=UPI00064EDEA2|nr:AMP-binding protein [Palaeococcus ferrophilus]